MNSKSPPPYQACGPNAIMIRFGDGLEPEATRALARSIDLELSGCREIVDYCLAYDQVLLEFPHPVQTATHGPAWMQRLSAFTPVSEKNARLHVIDVVYDGIDLHELAATHQMSTAELIQRHSAPIYTVEMIGFSPGFPYLTGLDPRLTTPRRQSPRPKIEAGSVAIGGSQTGIYSVASPGGWHVIGRSSAKLFDPEAGNEHAFLLRTGDRVQFVSVDANGEIAK